jgi:hypothetical protein
VKINRYGVTRTVLLIGKWAIKIPSLRGSCLGRKEIIGGFCRGVLANDSEREWSGTPGVCPVLWSFGGLVNIYPRCEPVAETENIDYDAIGFIGPTDRKPENLGWLNGRMVWVDYDLSWHSCAYCGRRRHPAPGQENSAMTQVARVDVANETDAIRAYGK